MNHQRNFDRELLIPLAVGGLSVMGIIVVLLLGRSLNTPPPVTVTPSSTPFRFVYLGTEPGIATLIVDGSELPPTEEPVDGFPTAGALPTFTRPPLATPIILTQPNGTRTATATRTRAATATKTSSAPANTYDDTDSRLQYSGSWVLLTGETGAYQETLHISNTTGNSVSFQFTGNEFHVFHDTSPTFGVVSIFIDDDALGITLNQAQSSGEWAHSLEVGTHRVEIRHTGGGSVNIDRIYIPAPTPTPTRTPTATP
jgi:hypothetical protein